MKKVLKYSISILLVLILGLVVTCAAFVYLVKPEQFKPVLNNMLTQTLGYKTSIEGELKWQFWPSLSLEAKKIEILNRTPATPIDSAPTGLDHPAPVLDGASPVSNKAASDLAMLATIDSIAFKVHLRPLLKGVIDFNQVILKKVMIRLQTGTPRRLVIDKFSTDILVSKQSIILSGIKTQLYGGSSEGSLNIQFTTPQPMITFKQQFYKINTGNLLEDVIMAKRINATGELALDLTTAGKTQEELLKQLNGNVTFNLSKGHIEGINIPRLINSIIKLFNGKPLEQKQLAVAPTNITEFGLLSGRATIKNGVVSNDELRIENPSFTTTGKGSLNLPTQSINYHLNTNLTKLDPKSELAKIQEQLGGHFPARVFGSVQKPILVPDLPNLLKERFKNFLNEQIDILLDKEEIKKASDKAKQILNKLLE